MPNLREQLRRCLQGHVCLVGVGNVRQGDDGFGVRLAEALLKSEIRNPKSEIPAGAAPGGSSVPELEVLVAGTLPERHVARLRDGGFDHVVFLDAVELGAAPGSVVLLGAGEIHTRFPQVSTHKLSLGLLAQLIKADGRTKVWLLGVQPQTLRPGDELSRRLATSLTALAGLLVEGLTAPEAMA